MWRLFKQRSRFRYTTKTNNGLKSHPMIDETKTFKQAITEKKFIIGVAFITCPLIYYYFMLYPNISKFPPKSRSYLRDALSAKNMKRWDLSEGFFKIAIEKMDEFGTPKSSQEYTGVLITLAEVYENNSKFDLAISTYQNIANYINELSPNDQLDGDKKLRLVNVYTKIFDLYRDRKENRKAIENINSALNLVLNPENLKSVNLSKIENLNISEIEKNSFALEIKWIKEEELCSLLEKAASFFREIGIVDYAIPLYKYNINYVTRNPCHTATLLCNLGEIYYDIKDKNTALSFLTTSLQIIKDHHYFTECKNAESTVLYNLGRVNEVLKSILFYRA